MAMPTFTTRLIEKEPLVADMVSFRWELPAAYEFKAGQWFVVTFPRAAADPTTVAADRATAPAGQTLAPESANEPWTHHFTHSNSPLDPVIEFTTRLRGSDFKNALDALSIGAEVEIEGPYGAFTLPQDVEKVAFLTGGIGITCVRSILRWLGQADPAPDARPNEMVLLFANRSEDAIPFREELEELSHTLPLRVVNVLSRPGTGWQGQRGHIDERVLTDELGQPADWNFYLSGPPSMDEDIRQLLLAWGADQRAIHVERFDGYE